MARNPFPMPKAPKAPMPPKAGKAPMPPMAPKAPKAPKMGGRRANPAAAPFTANAKASGPAFGMGGRVKKGY